MNKAYYIIDPTSGSFSTLTREAYEILKPVFEESTYEIEKVKTRVQISDCYDCEEYDWRHLTNAEILTRHFGKQIEKAMPSMSDDIFDGKTVCLIIQSYNNEH